MPDLDSLLQAASSGLIDDSIESEPSLQPRLISNGSAHNLLTEIERGLRTCSAFYFAAAFITQSGLIALKQTLKSLEERRVPGYILTTDYLCFTQPRALRELMQFKNIELRIYTAENFHIKGYIFQHGDSYSVIIGSGNMTQTALKSNKEWQLRLVSRSGGRVAKEALAEFQRLWQAAQQADDAWLEKYAAIYKRTRELHRQIQDAQSSVAAQRFSPNSMQKKALASIARLRAQGAKKALLISATGTGKTYLAAFAAAQAAPRRLLFIVHREQILQQAAAVFKRVMPHLKIGFLSGSHKDYSAPCLFATSAMMARPDILAPFAPPHFDFIIIDETHRAGAAGYRHILNHFAPQFLLGMTATPERTDGFDIFALFDHNIAYEIRLQEAMAERLLCPFHYFGIADITVNGREIGDDSAFNDLADEARAEHIISRSQFFGWSGSRVRGLVFCRSVEEACALSDLFSSRGFYTAALSGRNSQAEREQALRRLEQDERKGGLDYIFTVDILNEGVDIPAVNQVIMLRPTQSAIVFVQQMGRGLRKYRDKEYLVILDFIGSYKNNFMIPIALSGDKSCSKDVLRRCSAEGSSFLPGCSTVNFDEISRQRIYRAIDTAKLSSAALLKEAYLNLKHKLGTIPSVADFDRLSDIDIVKYYDKFGSYHAFLRKYDSDYSVRFSPEQEQMLTFICRRFGSGKRRTELLALKILTKSRSAAKNLLGEMNRHCSLTPPEQKSLIANLTNEFTMPNERAKYDSCVFIRRNEASTDYCISNIFAAALRDESFAHALAEILADALRRTERYEPHYLNTDLKLYEKYTYEEVCRLLNWPHKINPNAMAGYFYEKTTRTMPVFINYVDPGKKRVDYANQFLSDRLITAYSKSGRRMDSGDALHIYRAKEEGNCLYLFMRKPGDDKEAKEFYFLGAISAVGQPEPAPKYKGFKIVYRLHEPVRADLFDYFTAK